MQGSKNRSQKAGSRKKRTKPCAGLSKTDEKFLLEGQRRLIKTFKWLARGKTARMLNDTFEDFDLPLVAKRRGQPSSPSGAVLAFGAVIKLSELDLYENVLVVAKKYSKELRDLDALMDACNRKIRGILERTGIIYRGMDIAELEIIARHDGVFGLHPRKMYAAANDFVSFSIDVNIAILYSTYKDKRGLFAEVDVSDMDRSKCSSISYKAINNISVTGGGRRIYNPYERFGGSRSGIAMYESEVHLRVDSRPIIRTVAVIGDRSARFKGRLERAIVRLERAQKQKITIKYLPDQVSPWKN